MPPDVGQALADAAQQGAESQPTCPHPGVVGRVEGKSDHSWCVGSAGLPLQQGLPGDGPATEIGYRMHWSRTYLRGMSFIANTGGARSAGGSDHARRAAETTASTTAVRSSAVAAATR